MTIGTRPPCAAAKPADAEAATIEAQPGKKFDKDGNLITLQSDEAEEPEDDPREAELRKGSKLNSTAEAQAEAQCRENVVLKIRRRKFNPQLRAGEIVVTRRLFRTGESEYLLNGKLCRLRDIQDIFMGTGLGPESYAIIEQGRIGQILSSKPYDRRAIIEEAAGITKYKTQQAAGGVAPGSGEAEPGAHQ